MSNVSNCNELYEESQNAKRNKREGAISQKVLDCFNFIICWRSNRSDKKVFSETEKLSIIQSEK